MKKIAIYKTKCVIDTNVFSILKNWPNHKSNKEIKTNFLISQYFKKEITEYFKMKVV